jgi:hypothetical protein
MKTRALLLGLIASQLLCFAEENPDQKQKRIWGASYIGERVGDGRDIGLEGLDVSQGPEHLLGGFTLARQREGVVTQLVIKGHLNKEGEFTPNVSLEVSDREDGNWKTIESSFSDKVDVTLTGAPHVDSLPIRIKLDAFQPYIGKFKYCRVALQTGESDIFPMAWLTEKGHD